MNDLAKDENELYERLSKHFLAARPVGVSSEEFHNPQADVSVMMGYMFQHIEAAFRKNAWPDLLQFLSAASGVDQEVLINEYCRDVHHLVAKYILAVYQPDEEQCKHTGFEETLGSFGWHDKPLAARIAYCYMIGLFHLSRCWVIGRQANALGYPPAREFIDIAAAAGIELRIFDQRIDAAQEGLQTLTQAVVYASQLGATNAVILDTVKSALKKPSIFSRFANLFKLSSLTGPFSLAVEDEEK